MSPVTWRGVARVRNGGRGVPAIRAVFLAMWLHAGTRVLVQIWIHTGSEETIEHVEERMSSGGLRLEWMVKEEKKRNNDEDVADRKM